MRVYYNRKYHKYNVWIDWDSSFAAQHNNISVPIYLFVPIVS